MYPPNYNIRFGSAELIYQLPYVMKSNAQFYRLNHPMRFQVLTAVNMKFTVSWDVAPCSLLE
jgi:hypothetical protein